MSDTLVINEVYLSLQGESTFAGLPCIFVRLAACNLRCSYCDTAYAFAGGRKRTLEQVCEEVHRLAASYAAADRRRRTGDESTAHPRLSLGRHRLPLIELTGGEPLLQKNCLPLMKQLCDAGFTLLLETSGALDISPVDPRVRRIMDLKCPGSGEVERNRWENIAQLRETDELKFVIGSQEDYEWASRQVAAHRLDAICPVLFSWAHPLSSAQHDPSLKAVSAGQTPISRRELAERIIADALPVRFQLQMHKIIWPPEQRGV